MIDLDSMSTPALPEDVWRDILKDLSYSELETTVARLNKSFRLGLAHPSLAGRTFQDRPSADNTRLHLAREDFQPHPLFKKIVWDCCSPFDELALGGRDGGTKLADIAARHEPATSPAVDRLVVRITDSQFALPTRDLVDAAGVSVAQVFEAWCAITATAVPARYEYDCSRCGDARVCPICRSPDKTWADLMRPENQQLWRTVVCTVDGGKCVVTKERQRVLVGACLPAPPALCRSSCAAADDGFCACAPLADSVSAAMSFLSSGVDLSSLLPDFSLDTSE